MSQNTPSIVNTIPFGLRFRMLMLSREIKQKDIALKLGVTPESIRNWCRGNYFPANGFRMEKASVLFNVSREVMNCKSEGVMPPFVLKAEAGQQRLILDDGQGLAVCTVPIKTGLAGKPDINAFSVNTDIMLCRDVVENLLSSATDEGSVPQIPTPVEQTSEEAPRETEPAVNSQSIPVREDDPVSETLNGPLSECRKECLKRMAAALVNVNRSDMLVVTALAEQFRRITAALPEEEKLMFASSLASGCESQEKEKTELQLAVAVAWLIGILNRGGLRGLAVPWVRDKSLYKSTLNADCDKLLPLILGRDQQEFGEESAEGMRCAGLLPKDVTFDLCSGIMAHAVMWYEIMRPDFLVVDMQKDDADFFIDHLKASERFSDLRLKHYRSVLDAWIRFCEEMRC